MRRQIAWRPWQFSLRSLLLLTAMVALLVGWRAKRVQSQRRVGAEIRALRGVVESKTWGPAWLGQLGCGTIVREVLGSDIVEIELPGKRVTAAASALRALPSLRRIRVTYDSVDFGSKTYFAVDGRWVAADEPLPHDWLSKEFPTVAVEVVERPCIIY